MDTAIGSSGTSTDSMSTVTDKAHTNGGDVTHPTWEKDDKVEKY